jgi:hypoxanthine phosphoribosyltransferase
MSDFWTTYLSVIAAGVTVLMFFGILWKQISTLWQRKFLPKPKDRVVKQPFTYNDVHEGMRELVFFARNFRPDLIVGINRGGAIVGGILGKHLDCMAYVLEVVSKENRVRFTGDDDILKGKRILLVDDRISTGHHMKLAYEYLRSSAADIRTAVFAWIVDTGSGVDLQQGPDAFGYRVSSALLPFPWEPGHARSWD